MISKPTGMSPDGETIDLSEPSSARSNIFTSTGSIRHVEIDENGEIVGVSGKHGTYYTDVSDFLPVDAGTDYIIKSCNCNSYAAWYNSEKELIEVFKRDDNSIIISSPINAAYLRITYRARSGAYVETNELNIYKRPSYPEQLFLSCYVQSGSNIETFHDDNGKLRAYAQLIIWENDTYYNFIFDESSAYAPYVIEGSDGLEIRFELPITEEVVIGNYYRKSSYSSLNKYSIDLYNLIKVGRSYSWKIRLYEAGSITGGAYSPTIKIAYGTVSETNEVKSYISSNCTKVGYTFSIFPHLNIYDSVIACGSSEYSSSDDNGKLIRDFPNVANTVFDVMKNVDANIKYWINCGGYILPISKYRFYKYSYEEKRASDKYGLEFDVNFDGYGNPLSGYVVLEDDSYNTLKDNISSLSATIDEYFRSRTYSIYTNYIDSNWGYFEIANKPEIIITDNLGQELNDTKTYELIYSSLELNINYVQSQGVNLNYHSYKVYSYDEQNTEYVLDYYSGNKYNHALKISYDRFFNHKTYKIVISLVDINQRVYEQTIYFKTNFPAEDSNMIVDISYYRPHHSICCDII